METEVKKRGIIAFLTEYVRGSTEEVRKVTWPKKKDVIKYVSVILATSLIMAAVFALLDWGLSLGLDQLIKLAGT